MIANFQTHLIDRESILVFLMALFLLLIPLFLAISYVKIPLVLLFMLFLLFNKKCKSKSSHVRKPELAQLSQEGIL